MRDHFSRSLDRLATPACALATALACAGLLSCARGSESSRAGLDRPLQPPIIRTAAQTFPMAPDLNIGTDWLNTKKPLSLADLRGHVVLLDFWTLC